MPRHHKISALLVVLFSCVVAFCCTCTGNSTGKLQPIPANTRTLDDELAQLETLSTPDGTNEAVFNELKAELGRVLSAQGVERFVSTPPMDANSACPLTWDGGSGTLSWEYYCTGDYDQNSEVNIADLTPLGQNIGAVGPFDPASQLSVIDGDNNSELNIADVTPIGQNYLTSVSGYNVYASDSLSDYPADAASGNGEATPLGTVAFNDGQASTGQRTQFSFTVSDPQAGTYFWVRPSDGTSDGTPSAYYYLEKPANEPPVAALTADPLVGDVPMVVAFDASQSSDPDGAIVKYEWDWDGAENSWEWHETGTTPTTEHTYNDIDTYGAVVRVTDDLGETDTASVTVWATSVGNELPIAVLTADPYTGVQPLEVSFDANGSTDSDGAVANYEWDFNGDGTYGELGAEAEAEGTAALVHVYEETGTFNAAVRVTDIEGGQESAVQEITVHPPGWVQIPLPVSGVAAPSLAVIDGHPAVSLCINDSVLYVRADSVTGDSPEDWPDPVEVDAPTTVSLLNDLAEINGNPAIAYTADSAFRFARSVSSEGMNAADWSQKAEIAQPEDSNGTGFLSLALISGNPAVSYYVAKLSPTRCLIVFNRASTATGSNDADWTDYVTVHEYETWWVPQGPPALCDVLGHPALAYYADSGEGLRLFYVWSTTSTGGSAADWSQKVQFNYTINKIGSLFCRLAKAAFCPAIVYISKNSLGDTEYVNYIRATTSTGQLLGDWAEGAQWEHTSSGYWFCGLAMAAGNPAIVYHDADASALMFTISETSDGGNSDDWSEPEDVAEKPAWGYCDLAAVYGNPAFVYADDNEKQVYYCYLRR